MQPVLKFGECFPAVDMVTTMSRVGQLIQIVANT